MYKNTYVKIQMCFEQGSFEQGNFEVTPLPKNIVKIHTLCKNTM